MTPRNNLKNNLKIFTHAVFPLIKVMDTGKDPDTMNSLIITGNFTTQGLVHTLCLTANMAPAEMRAKLTEAAGMLLGIEDVPVGIGTTCGQEEKYKATSYQWSAKYFYDHILRSRTAGIDLMHKQLSLAEDYYSVTWLMVSGKTDTAEFMRKYPKLFRKKVRNIVMMSGVCRTPEGILFSPDGSLIPDDANNNTFDWLASCFVYRKAQAWGIPVTVLTKEAAYNAPVGADYYDELAATGHPIGIHLKDMQKDSLNHLWKRCNLAADDPAREGIPPRCHREWFLNTFCGLTLDECDRKGSEPIWNQVKKLFLYDPMTVIAATKYKHIWFDPCTVDVWGTQHEIIGMSMDNHNIKYPKAFSGFMQSQLISSLDLFEQASDDESPLMQNVFSITDFKKAANF